MAQSANGFRGNNAGVKKKDSAAQDSAFLCALHGEQGLEEASLRCHTGKIEKNSERRKGMESSEHMESQLQLLFRLALQ